MVTAEQFVDPAVSRTKFDREVAEYRQFDREYRRRGWILMEAEYPRILVLLAAVQVRPPAVVMGVRFDYSNYDALPPSVVMVNPFTDEPYTAAQLPTTLRRTVEGSAGLPGFQIPGLGQAMLLTQQPLMQAYGPDELPFLCLAGVREYHDHAGHSGDRWELHRTTGAGRLVRLLEVITKYGITPITDYQVTLTPSVAGFVQGEPPA